MAASHATGAAYQRKGSTSIRHTYWVRNNTSTVATKWLTIKASPTKPVIVNAQLVVTTADGGTTPTMSLGSVGAGYTDLINVASTATAAVGGTFLPAANSVGKYIFFQDTDIYYKQGGTPNGAGATILILLVHDVNSDPTLY